MDSHRKAACTLFSKLLGQCLVEHFGRVPSASKFADAFNLRAYGTTTITRETGRKWLNGVAIPESGRLKVLVDWLGLKPSLFLDPAEKPRSAITTKSPSEVPSNRLELQASLMNLLLDLDDESAELVFLTAWALREMRRGSKRKIDYQRLAMLLS